MKKGRVAARRIGTGVEKIIIIVGFLFFSIFFSYFCIAYIVKYIEEDKLQSLLKWREVFDWYVTEAEARTGYIPAITVASASLMLSLITLLQSHFNRIQDRVMSFPPNYLDTVGIGLDVRPNLNFARKYFDPVESENLIQLNYKGGFSTYYKFHPYRLFVCLSKGNKRKGREWEEIELHHFQYSSIRDSEADTYEVLIEGNKSRLLKKYCDMPDRNENFKIRFILDSRWTNRLTPWWMRNLSDMYIREEFGLSCEKFIKESDPVNMEIFNAYKVLFSEYKKAPLASWILSCQCLISKRKLSKKYIIESENTKQLQERGSRHGH